MPQNECLSIFFVFVETQMEAQIRAKGKLWIIGHCKRPSKIV